MIVQNSFVKKKHFLGSRPGLHRPNLWHRQIFWIGFRGSNSMQMPMPMPIPYFVFNSRYWFGADFGFQRKFIGIGQKFLFIYLFIFFFIYFIYLFILV